MMSRLKTAMLATLSVIWLIPWMLPHTVWSLPVASCISWLGANDIPSRPYLVGVTVVTAVILFIYYRISINPPGSVALLICISILVLDHLAVAWTTSSPLVMSNCVRFVTGWAIGAVVVAVCARRLVVVGVVVSALGAVQAVYALALFRLGINMMTSGTVDRAGGTFNQPDVLSLWLAVALPIGILLLIHEKVTWRVISLSLIVGLTFSALLLTWNRADVAAEGVGLLFVILRVFPDLLWRTRIAITLALILGVVFIWHVRSSGPVNVASSGRSDAGRIGLWGQSAHIIATNPIFGYGLGALELPVLIKSHNTVAVAVFIQPKNLYLYWLAELGLMGAVLGTATIVLVIKALRSSAAQAENIGLSAAWIVILVTGLADTTFGPSRPVAGNVIFGILTGATLFLPLQRLQNSRPISELPSNEHRTELLQSPG